MTATLRRYQAHCIWCGRDALGTSRHAHCPRCGGALLLELDLERSLRPAASLRPPDPGLRERRPRRRPPAESLEV